MGTVRAVAKSTLFVIRLKFRSGARAYIGIAGFTLA